MIPFLLIQNERIIDHENPFIPHAWVINWTDIAGMVLCRIK